MNIHLRNRVNKSSAIIFGAVVLSVAMGIVAYFAMKTLMPRDEAPISGNSAAQMDQQSMIETATQLRKAADEAVIKNDYVTAESKLKEAKRLYTEAGETKKVAEISDLLAYIQNETNTDMKDMPIETYEFKP